MYDLTKAYFEARDMVIDAGFDPGEIVDVKMNTRAKSRWGNCKREFGVYKIDINADLLDERNNYQALVETLAHEILHTIEGCWNHGPKWKAAADRVNAMYGTHIQRSSTQEEKGVAYRTLPTLRNETAKYKLVCKKCGHEYLYKRCTKAIQHPENYRCACCKGELRREYIPVNGGNIKIIL